MEIPGARGSILGASAFLWLLVASGAQPTVCSAETLPRIGPAPGFALTKQDGSRLTLADLSGKVVAVSFIYTHCPDVCPLLTAKLLAAEKALGSAAASQVRFVAITMDPFRDTPAVLNGYARALGVDPQRWAFLTGSEDQVLEVTRRYGIYHRKQPDGFVDHNLLTSIVDRSGQLRVQYMGPRFDPLEFAADLRNLVDEGPDASD